MNTIRNFKVLKNIAGNANITATYKINYGNMTTAGCIAATATIKNWFISIGETET